MLSKTAEVCLFFFVIATLIQSPLVHAQEDEEPPVINIEINLDEVINAISGLGSALGDTVSSVPGQVFDIFKDSFKASVKGFDSPLLALTYFLLSANPNPEPLFNWWQSIILIISSFYLLLFLVIGFMFLLSSIDAQKRVEAKEWLKNAFIMLVGVNVSFLLYKLLLELATAITQFMWINGFEQFFQETIFSNAGSLLLILYAFSIGLALLTLFIRYVFLLVGVMLFPVGIFLYYIPPLKNWGKIIFNLIGIALFMQFLDIIVFIASNQVALDLAGQEGAIVVPALAFLLVGILNLVLIFYATLKSAFSATENAPVLAFAFGAITGQISSLIRSIKIVVPKK